MSKYTLELRQIVESGIDIFDFNYPFYAPELRNQWEVKFINHYYFNEIGAETIERWKHQLKSRLNMIYPKYLKLYETELKSLDIDFLRNKDLVETFERELNNNVITENQQNSSNNQNTNTQNENYNDITSSTNQTTNSENKISDLGNGLAMVDPGSLTHIENNTNNDNTNETNNVNSQGSSSSQNNSIGEVIDNNKTDSNIREKTTLRSLGNIGVTSSADLLEKWRNVIQDLQKEMIDECKDLFMLVY